MITQRDRVFGFVSFSCSRGECERCYPRKEGGTPADTLAPNCVHSCHDPYATEVAKVKAAEDQALLEDRRRVLGF